jgi:hypothetical protein
MMELILFCALCRPQPKLPRVADRKFITIMAILGTAKTMDAVSTERMLNRGGHENNSMFGRYPSTGRIAGVNAAYFSGEVALAHVLNRYGRRHRWARYLWLLEPSFQAAQHIQLAYMNFQIKDIRR